MVKQMPKLSRVILRGLRRRCPQCGVGRIFSGYLTIEDACPHCQESFEGIRTDDAAPWATILLLGHILAPIVMIVIKFDISTLPLTIIMAVLALVLALGILPLMKGVFVGLNWRFNIRDGRPVLD
tara:strand:+ start:2276 stop:2650 length:375 start_codon:yes stop_codon:yes gene_type:complete